MSLFLSATLSFILLYKYLAVFIIIFMGAFLVPLPGNTVIIAAGAFSSQGYMHLSFVFLLILTTNISADILGFSLTHKYGEKILLFFHIKRDGKLVSVEKKLREFAFGTIFLTRLAGPFGPTVNFVSGLIGVPMKKFLAADLLGNVTDITLFLGLGYFLGNYWQSVLGYIWIMGCICVVLFLLYVYLEPKFKKN